MSNWEGFLRNRQGEPPGEPLENKQSMICYFGEFTDTKLSLG